MSLMSSKDEVDDDLSLSSNEDLDPSNEQPESEGAKSASSGTSSTDMYKEVRDLTKQETKDVDTWRELVTGLLVISACFFTTATFIYLSQNETYSFRMAYDQYVSTIVDAAAEMERNLHNAFTEVTDSITSDAQTTGSSWPFVTSEFMEVHGSRARSISHVDYFSFCPLVNETGRAAWEAYSVENQWWLEGNRIGALSQAEKEQIVRTRIDNGQGIPEEIYHFPDENSTTDLGEYPYGPRWQISPPPYDPVVVNYNMFSGANIGSLFMAMVATNGPVMSEILPESHSAINTLSVTPNVPSSIMLYPVYETFNRTADEVVAFLEILLSWKSYLSLLLPEGEGGVYYVLNNNCDAQQHTFQVSLSTSETIYEGVGDHHETLYDRYIATVPLHTQDVGLHIRPCSYYVDVYPSAELRSEFSTPLPGTFTAVVACIFFLMAFCFFAYDKFVQVRNEKVVRQAAKTNAIVASLFPTNVRARLFGGDANSEKSGISSLIGSSRLKSFLRDSMKSERSVAGTEDAEDRPIADLFPHCTVLFADIVGFTAWSSMREPTQVFQLLEAVYHAFDDVAKRRKVFKVETIGDCYVAVTGLPEPHKHHALLMAKFSRDCMYKMHEVTRSLEVSLGPDTGDLSMRFGLHSGPVTAGVLRGERSRFQLFGDTVNTASRMESTGRKGCIHLSQETALELTNSGKARWIRERTDRVKVKGKGEMTTFWLSLAEYSSVGDGTSSCGDTSIRDMGAMDASFSPAGDSIGLQNLGDAKKASYYATGQSRRDLSSKNARLVEWNVDVLERILKQIAAKRKVAEKANQIQRIKTVALNVNAVETAKPQMVLEEVAEVITLPKFESKVAGLVEDYEEVDLSDDVHAQLSDFVTEIASMYHDNPFHNFEHASHVTMSVVKLLSRIVAPAELDYAYDEARVAREKRLLKHLASKMHDHTYGITSDPLTQFAVVLSGLIHDVDHLGVPNAQLVKEGTELADRYKNKSVAEQNSVDLAWELLMKPEYAILRMAICNKYDDWKRFRQLVVNSVLATDIVDKELKELRNARWDKAFKGNFTEEDPDTNRNRKATIVIEHLIQASDVSHTMQHWHIYRKWNERLFLEMYRAYKEGRAEKDPSEFWYQGEIGFFNFYIIPLAKKLKECGVFGVSSDEYLNYAQQNLREWQTKGEQATAEMVRKAQDNW